MPNLNISLSFSDVGAVITRFSTLVGHRQLSNALDKVSAQLGERQIRTEQMLDRYAIPVGLGEARKFKKTRGCWPKPTESLAIYEACTFAASAVAIAGHLSPHARTNLVGRIIDGLKWSGDPRPLQFEFTAANIFARKGWEIFFTDLEKEEDFDFLIRQGTHAVEIECKTVSGDLGNAVHQAHALNLFENNFEELVPMASGCCRFFDFIANKRLPSNEDCQRKLIRSAIECAQLKSGTLETEDCCIETWTEPLPNDAGDSRQQFVLTKMQQLQQRLNGQALAVFSDVGILFLCASSRRQSKLQDYVFRSIKKASGQLSGHRPGYIWTHFVDLRDQHIRHLNDKSQQKGPTGFDGISRRIFDSDNRKHLLALGYSAKSPVIRRQEVRDSSLATRIGEEGSLIIHGNRRSAFSLPDGIDFP